MKNKNLIDRSIRPVLTLLAATAATLLAGQAQAFKLDTGNEDVEVRFDNTVKYNAGLRMEDRDRRIADTWVYQAGEYGFNKGDLVTNRIDLLSEFDVVYKNYHGFRLSAAAWKDAAYDKKVRGNPAYQAAGLGTAYPNNRFPNTVSRYYTQSGELLDAFVFTRINFDDMPLSLKAGKHTLYWGESLFSPIHGVSYGQSPLDLRKGVATPGIDAKELFLPTKQISAHFQINPKLSMAAQLPLEWAPTRFYEGGTYFTAADFLFQGGTTLKPAPGVAIPYLGNLKTGPNAVPKNKGSYGLMMKGQVEPIDSTVGFYVRRFDDVAPSVLAGSTGLYNAYAKEVKLMGVSLAKSVAGVAVGAELVHRQNAALQNKGGQQKIARGDSWTGLVNALAYVGKTPLFDSATLLAEATFTKLDKVNADSVALFDSCENTGAERRTGCATKSSLGMSLAFTPTWFQVFPSIDLTLPMNYSRGLSGNSPIGPAGGVKNDGSWSIGVGAEYKGQYKIDLAYRDYFGTLVEAPNPYAATPGISPVGIASGSSNGVLKDRGWLSLTLKTTF